MDEAVTIFKRMMEEKYYSRNELCYETKPGIFLAPYEYQELLNYKQMLLNKKDARLKEINVLAWDNKPLFYSSCTELLQLKESLSSATKEDYFENDSFLSFRHADEIERSRIYSEIEGSVGIENVPTTRKRVQDLIQKRLNRKQKTTSSFEIWQKG